MLRKSIGGRSTVFHDRVITMIHQRERERERERQTEIERGGRERERQRERREGGRETERERGGREREREREIGCQKVRFPICTWAEAQQQHAYSTKLNKIGRASCRERVSSPV